MVSTRYFGRFAVVFAGVMLIVAGFAAVSHGTGQIVEKHTLSVDVIKPTDKAVFTAGEQIPLIVRTSGLTGLKITAKDAATGREEEVTASLVKNEGSGTLAPKMWNALWPTAGRKPGAYVFTLTGLSGSTAPRAKTVTVSVVQPSGPANITFTEPAGGHQVKAGEDVSVSVKASGVNKVAFFIKDLQTGTEKYRPPAHVSGTDKYSTSWSTEGLQKGNYRIIARGLGADGKVMTEASVTMSVTGGAPALPTAHAAKPVVAPNVIGMTEHEAVTALSKAGLKVNPIKYVSTSKQGYWGKVVEQSIKAGTQTTEPISITIGRK